MPRRPAVPPDWPSWPDDQLLDVRMADLPVTIDGSTLESRIDQLRTELLSIRDLLSLN